MQLYLGGIVLQLMALKLFYGELLTALYEDESIEEPDRRDTIISNIEQQKELLLRKHSGPEIDMMHIYVSIQ